MKLEEEPAEKKLKPNPCIVCLGTLQDAYMMPRYSGNDKTLEYEEEDDM